MFTPYPGTGYDVLLTRDRTLSPKTPTSPDINLGTKLVTDSVTDRPSVPGSGTRSPARSETSDKTIVPGLDRLTYDRDVVFFLWTGCSGSGSGSGTRSRDGGSGVDGTGRGRVPGRRPEVHEGA